MTSSPFRQPGPVSTCWFWGALWGFTEASLGHLLHLFGPSGYTGTIMYPLAFYFMSRAAREARTATAPFGVAAVAGLVKLADLVLPWRTPLSVVNPALAILLEGAAAGLALGWLRFERPRERLAAGLAAAAGWRIAYLAASAVLHRLLAAGPGLATRARPVRLGPWLVQTLLNALLISLLPPLSRPVRGWMAQKRPWTRLVAAGALSALAIFLQAVWAG